MSWQACYLWWGTDNCNRLSWIIWLMQQHANVLYNQAPVFLVKVSRPHFWWCCRVHTRISAVRTGLGPCVTHWIIKDEKLTLPSLSMNKTGHVTQLFPTELGNMQFTIEFWVQKSSTTKIPCYQNHFFPSQSCTNCIPDAYDSEPEWSNPKHTKVKNETISYRY